jgi:hypothetical protein
MGSMIILKAIQNRELVLKEYFKFKRPNRKEK